MPLAKVQEEQLWFRLLINYITTHTEKKNRWTHLISSREKCTTRLIFTGYSVKNRIFSGHGKNKTETISTAIQGISKVYAHIYLVLLCYSHTTLSFYYIFITTQHLSHELFATLLVHAPRSHYALQASATSHWHPIVPALQTQFSLNRFQLPTRETP